jgi:hypothetical protein
MIISHQHRFIFAAVPKTGTHSVRQALREHMSEDDIEQVGLFVNKRFPFEELAAIRHGHLSLQQVRPYIGEEAFAGYFKFAFVRNPFDRFVSYCAFMSRDSGHFARAPQDVMRYFLFDAPPEQHILFQPQSSVLADADGRLLTDMVGRVETMQSSFEAICARIGIPPRALAQVNGSTRGDYRAYYTDELKDAVATRYARDIELFGYAF